MEGLRKPERRPAIGSRHVYEENPLRPQRFVLPTILMLLALGFFPASSAAQNQFNYSVGLLFGLGGSPDADPDTDFDNFGFEAYFSMETELRTKFVVRAGQLGLESEGAFVDADLSYLTLSGEYDFSRGSYKSGLFLGVGAYDLSANRGVADESALGLTLGTTGDIRINDRLSVIVQFTGHYVDIDFAQFFVTGHAGLAFHF